jgi:hypothetical protein
MPLNQVQRFPSGLLELLGMKGTGEFPKELAGIYSGVIPLHQLLARSTMQFRTVFDPAAAQGGIVQFQVPERETWLLVATNVRVAGAVAITSLGVATYVTANRAAGAVTQAVNASRFQAPYAPANLHSPWQPAVPWVLLSGDQIQAVLAEIAGAATTGLVLDISYGVFT